MADSESTKRLHNPLPTDNLVGRAIIFQPKGEWFNS